MTGTPPGLRCELTVRRRDFRVSVRLDVARGEVLAVLGPNGAGKSTLLRALAGLEPVSSGFVELSGRLLDDANDGVRVPVEQRRIGVVFQDYRLFPHLSVVENVAFGLRARGVRRGAARDAAREWVARLGLAEMASRRPGHLSGGQAQRVALARALVTQPEMLLLDEPLAALDARTRLEVRSELRQHLREFGGPSLVVTHDALDALVLGDRILVLEGGRTVQSGPPAEVAQRPATEYVARLVGLNLYAGTAVGPAARGVELDGGGRLIAAGIPAVDDDEDGATPVAGASGEPGRRVLVAVAPSAISLFTSAPIGISQRNVWPGTVRGMELLTDRVRIAVDGMPSALVDVTPAAVADLDLVPGRKVWLAAKATEVIAYPGPPEAPRDEVGS